MRQARSPVSGERACLTSARLARMREAKLLQLIEGTQQILRLVTSTSR
ncbi:hypothetical protein ACIQ8D_23470 [Streptomyces sp. NPDC096094]